MKSGFFFTALLLMMASGRIFAQEFTVPVNPVLVNKEDYAPYEKDIIAAANWLKAVSPDDQKEKRLEVYLFVFKWVNGSPAVTVMLTSVIMDFEKKNSGMMMMYMAFAAKYVLENNYSKDVAAQKEAAIRDLIAVYKNWKGAKKDKKMEKLIEAEASGKLGEWIKDNMKTDNN